MAGRHGKDLPTMWENFLGQGLNQLADLLVIWLAANALWAVLILTRGGLTPKGLRVHVRRVLIPAIILGATLNAVFGVFLRGRDPWLAFGSWAFSLAVMGLIVAPLLRSRRRQA
jgi:uncharacterized membrane protein